MRSRPGTLFRGALHDEARTQAVPAYVILHDRTLAEIAAARPGDVAALGAIGGIGARKLERYGAALLALVAARGGVAAR